VLLLAAGPRTALLSAARLAAPALGRFQLFHVAERLTPWITTER
jgi:hypothetical protein